tara:strand:- start:9 stop:1031 length:1023 start_codon:yes stop_codon:yes gene_type:complete
MLGTTFYNSSIRKMVSAFGTLFNNINIERENSSGVKESIKVPLAFAPKHKFTQRITQITDANYTGAEVQGTTPRMAFEYTALTYDPTRKLNTVQKTAVVKSGSSTTLDRYYQRVPYTMDFSLYLWCTNTEDGLQVVEQILPYFTPEFSISVNDILKTDIPIVLVGVEFEDTALDGDMDTRRRIEWTLNFSMQTYLYGPKTNQKVITKPITQFYLQDTSQVKSIKIVSEGTGYSDGTSVAVLGGSGTGLTVDVTVASGQVIKATIKTPGRGYSLNDTVVISGGNKDAKLRVEELEMSETQTVDATNANMVNSFSRHQIVTEPTTAEADDTYTTNDTITLNI